jgi:hypothetical protein
MDQTLARDLFARLTGSSAVQARASDAMPPIEGVRPIDRALIGYGRAFEHPCKIRLVRWLARRLAAVTLETVLNQLVRPAARPVVLKIDVEGFEPAVLAGLDFDGRFRPKHVLIECDDALCARSWGSRQRFAAFFAERGYDLFDVSGKPFACGGALPEANVWARDRSSAC